MENVKRKSGSEIEFVSPLPVDTCIAGLNRFFKEIDSRQYPVTISITQASHDTWHFTITQKYPDQTRFSWRDNTKSWVKIRADGYLTALANGSTFAGVTSRIDRETYRINIRYFFVFSIAFLLHAAFCGVLFASLLNIRSLGILPILLLWANCAYLFLYRPFRLGNEYGSILVTQIRQILRDKTLKLK